MPKHEMTVVRLAWRNDLTPEQWSKAPTYKTIQARVVSANWCAHPHEWIPRKWNLTHRLTGFSAGCSLASFGIAQRLGKALDRKFGKRAWQFTDPQTAKTMHGALPIIRKYEAMRGR